MLKSSRLPPIERAASFSPTRRNPFHLGDFDGVNLRRAIVMQRSACALAVIVAGAVAAGALYLASVQRHESACIFEIETADGNVYAAGTGDTMAGAMEGAQIPPDWREMHWRGQCSG